MESFWLGWGGVRRSVIKNQIKLEIKFHSFRGCPKMRRGGATGKKEKQPQINPEEGQIVAGENTKKVDGSPIMKTWTLMCVCICTCACVCLSLHWPVRDKGQAKERLCQWIGTPLELCLGNPWAKWGWAAADTAARHHRTRAWANPLPHNQLKVRENVF